MIEEKIVISNSNGIDARTSAIFVQSASKYVSNVWLQKDKTEVNAKSIMGLMSLALAKGNSVILKVDGADEEKCIRELKSILNPNL